MTATKKHLLGTLIIASAFLYKAIMTDRNVPAAVEQRPKVRWTWLILGCGCLLTGALYLGFVDLGIQISDEPVDDATDQTITLTSTESDGVTAE